MRSIRDRISKEISGMSWIEEEEYLRSHIGSFEALFEKTPNNRIERDAKNSAVFQKQSHAPSS